MTDDRDVRLIQRARTGDPDAFRDLYEKYKSGLHRFAHRMLLDADLAADVVQETFAYFFRKIPDYRPEVKTTTFLYRVARNRCLNIIESRRRRPAAPLDEIPEAESTVERDPADLADRKDQACRAGTALMSLSPDHREVVVLRIEKDMTYPEMANILGIPEGTVKSRLHLALSALRKKMKKE